MTDLYPADRHEPLASQPWDAGLARAEIEVIVADTRAAMSSRGLWPVHPKDGEAGSPPRADLYTGAAGVIWALDHLAREGAVRPSPSLARHLPPMREKTHAYCHVTLKDGQAFVVMPWAEIMSIRDKSQGWQSAKRFGKTADAPWSLYEDRMAAKTAVRALANHGEMSLSIEFQDAMAVDEAPVDYAGYAQNPSAGASLQSDIIDNDTGEVLDGETVTEKAEVQDTKKAEPAPTEQAKAAPAPKEEAKAEAKPAPAVDTDKLAQQAKTILRDLSEAGQGNTKAVLEMYEVALNDIAINSPDLMEQINNRAAAIEAGEYSEGE